MIHPRLPLLALLVTLVSCASGPSRRIVDSASGLDIEMSALADAVAGADVVFLGETHDSDIAHEMQLELTRALADRRGTIAVSFEMFERDVQGTVDDYLAGRIDEEQFLAGSRPWPRYAAHYRPAIELAKARGFDAIAANCPRELAARVAKEGLASVAGNAHVAREVDATDGAYRDRFVEAMGDHMGVDDENMSRVFAAQCLKDDTMAESIARYLDKHGASAPQVVHWCGKFHSDYGLGTVERLRSRRPDIEIAIVTTVPRPRVRGELDPEDVESAQYIWVVRGDS